MATEGDDVESIDTRLTKGNEAPSAIDVVSCQDDVSNLTGENRESKAKAYATEE